MGLNPFRVQRRRPSDYLLVGEYPRDCDIAWLSSEHRVTAIHNLQDDEDLRINALDIAVLREVSARHGMAWYEFDPNYWGIWLLEKMGLATKVNAKRA